MSTYSSNLKIELIGTGEQAGTWGVTTDDNFSNVFEQAIVGRVNVPFTNADVTLTATNSVASQSFRNVYLNCTGTNAASRNLIVPTINKNYVVQNNTTGGFDIVVKTVAGTGITVPNGRTCTVYADGTNVIQAFDYLPTLNVPTLNITTLDTTNIEVTNIKAKDGTASATIADSTGIFTHSTATVFTAGTVSLPSITTTGDTNTGIFFPAADTIAFTEGGVESMRIDSSGNVGIGATSGGAKLQITSASSGGQLSVSTATNGGLFVTDGTVNGVVYASSGPIMTVGTTSNHGLQLFTNNSQKMVIEAGGNVGIGTSTPTGGGGGTILNIFGSSAASLRVNTSTVTFDIFTSSTTAFIQTGSNHPLAIRTNSVTRMILDTSGNVGVGTGASTITDRFTVVGVGEAGGISDAGGKDAAIRVASTDGNANSGGQIEFGSGYGSYAQSYFAGIKGLLNNGSGNSTGNLAFYTRNAVADTSLTERMRIDQIGNVGIGTNNPSAKLHVVGSTVLANFIGNNANNYIQMSDNNGTNLCSVGSIAGGNWYLYSGGYGAFYTGATERMRIDSSGNVLVGTSGAIGKLAVVTPTTGYGFVMQGRSSDGQSIMSSMDRSGTVYTGNLTFPEDGSILFGRLNTGSQTERMRITSAGNVGINTSAPLSTFQANGNIGFYANNSSDGAQLYIGSSGFDNSSYYNSAPGIGAVYDANTVVAGALGLFVYAGVASSRLKVMNINANGNVALTNGTTTANGIGITFPATQSASGDANCLDDYEEGTWTPTMFGNATAGTWTPNGANAGIYVKVGTAIILQYTVSGTLTGSTGNIRIGGFPFSMAGSAYGGTSTISYWANLNTNVNTLMAYCDNGSTYTNLTYTDTPVSTILYISGNQTSVQIIGTVVGRTT
jgi:hypothetical protein